MTTQKDDNLTLLARGQVDQVAFCPGTKEMSVVVAIGDKPGTIQAITAIVVNGFPDDPKAILGTLWDTEWPWNVEVVGVQVTPTEQKIIAYFSEAEAAK
jgi:hypothetical protein